MFRIAAAAALVLPLYGVPGLAFDRPPQPEAPVAIVSGVADLDGPARAHVPRHAGHADAYWYWRYRARYTRWMHNEYVRAGYPVRHRQFRTYARVYPYACCRYRHW